MSYKVYKVEIGSKINEIALEQFLNGLKGEVIAIVPNIVPRFHLMGATANYDYLLIIEKEAE